MSTETRYIPTIKTKKIKYELQDGKYVAKGYEEETLIDLSDCTDLTPDAVKQGVTFIDRNGVKQTGEMAPTYHTLVLSSSFSDSLGFGITLQSNKNLTNESGESTTLINIDGTSNLPLKYTVQPNTEIKITNKNGAATPVTITNIPYLESFEYGDVGASEVGEIQSLYANITNDVDITITSINR